MSTLSGLSDSVREYVGHTLTMRLEYGWGWTLHTHDGPEAEPFSDIHAVNLTSVRVVPSKFFADGGASTRGFLGRVAQSGHLLDGLPILAFTISDGFDNNFTTGSAWRFFAGEGELVCPPDSFPRLHGARVIGGYGRVIAESQIGQNA
jgi:hypothetical protein